jgi:hypothetical protein
VQTLQIGGNGHRKDSVRSRRWVRASKAERQEGILEVYGFFRNPGFSTSGAPCIRFASFLVLDIED